MIALETMKKTENPVRVPIPAFVGEALFALPFKGRKEGVKYWFWTCQGETDTCVNAWRNDIAELMQRAQKPDQAGRLEDPFEHNASTHTLRHTFACLALAAGAHLSQVQRWLGHTSLKTTEKHYAHANKHAHAVSDAAYDEMVRETVRQGGPAEPPKVIPIHRKAAR